mgnify:CR=1 FL=1
MDNRPIGIFDSGVGGVTVLKELQKKLPNENYIYIGDTASFPYGSKSKQKIIELSKKRIENLIDMNVKLIVIACGTATSQALEEMKKIFNIPIIGIIKPTINYIKKENIKRIGVIATAGTIRSKGWQNQIEKDIDNVFIKSKACPLLAPLAEEGWTENKIAKLTIHEYLKEMKDIDALILGCTHYPLFKNIIEEEIGKDIKTINTGEMVAIALEEYIIKNNLRNESNINGNIKIFLTDLESNFINVARKLLNDDYINIKKLE